MTYNTRISFRGKLTRLTNDLDTELSKGAIKSLSVDESQLGTKRRGASSMR